MTAMTRPASKRTGPINRRRWKRQRSSRPPPEALTVTAIRFMKVKQGCETALLAPAEVGLTLSAVKDKVHSSPLYRRRTLTPTDAEHQRDEGQWRRAVMGRRSARRAKVSRLTGRLTKIQREAAAGSDSTPTRGAGVSTGRECPASLNGPHFCGGRDHSAMSRGTTSALAHAHRPGSGLMSCQQVWDMLHSTEAFQQHGEMIRWSARARASPRRRGPQA